MKILSEMAGFFYFYTMNKGLTQNHINKTLGFSNGTTFQFEECCPFGMMQKGRSFKKTGLVDELRFGVQGSERDDEMKGEGNSYKTFFRQLDPVFQAWQSTYCSMDNNPI